MDKKVDHGEILQRAEWGKAGGKAYSEAADRHLMDEVDTELDRYTNLVPNCPPNLIYPNYGNKETCPPYYSRWKIEPNTFNIINGVTTDVGNIIKYIMRHDMKDGLRDLLKARDYLNMMIEHHYGKENV